MAVHRNRVIYQSEALFISPDATGYHYTGSGGYGLMTPPINATQVSGDVLNGRGQLVGWKCGDTWPKWNGDGKNSGEVLGAAAKAISTANTMTFSKIALGAAGNATNIVFNSASLGAVWTPGTSTLTISATGMNTIDEIIAMLAVAGAAALTSSGMTVVQTGGGAVSASLVGTQATFTKTVAGAAGNGTTIKISDNGTGAPVGGQGNAGALQIEVDLGTATVAELTAWLASGPGVTALASSGLTYAATAAGSDIIAAIDPAQSTAGGADSASRIEETLITAGGVDAALYAPAQGSIIKQLKRVQTANYGFTINRQDINQFGNLARLDSIVIDSPTVNLDFSYYLTDGFNERMLEFVTDGVTNSFSGHLSPEMYQAGNNYFVLTVPEARDAVLGDVNLSNEGKSLEKSVISLGNGYITDYSVDFSVGGIPTASVTVEGMNIRSDFGETGNDLPSIDMANGQVISDAWDGGVKGSCKSDGCTGLYTLPAAESGYTGCGDVAALRPGDIVINLNNSSLLSRQVSGSSNNPSVGSAHIQSASISLPMARTTLQRLGSTFGFSKSLDVPITTTLSVSAILSDLKKGKLTDLLCGCETKELSITVYDPDCMDCTNKDGAVAIQYIFKGARLESESFSSTIGDNKTVDLTFSAQVGGSDDPNNGVYISGKESSEATIKGFPPAWTGANGALNTPTGPNGNLLGYRK